MTTFTVILAESDVLDTIEAEFGPKAAVRADRLSLDISGIESILLQGPHWLIIRTRHDVYRLRSNAGRGQAVTAETSAGLMALYDLLLAQWRDAR